MVAEDWKHNPQQFHEQELEWKIANQEFSGILVVHRKICESQDEYVERGTYLISRRAMVLGQDPRDKI
jgi:hypothetical protein